MDKNKVYKEMCRFLANQEQTLQEFKDFHEQNSDKSDYEELFDESYGAMYDSFKITNERPAKASTESKKQEKQEPTINDSAVIREYIQLLWREGIHNDIRIIRKWMQFFGWLTVISIILYMIFLIVGLSKL